MLPGAPRISLLVRPVNPVARDTRNIRFAAAVAVPVELALARGGGHVHVTIKDTPEMTIMGIELNDDTHINILINNKPFKATKPEMTGREIKELGGGPLEYLLVQVVKSPDPVAGGDDIQIGDDQAVVLKSGMHFRIVNPATFG